MICERCNVPRKGKFCTRMLKTYHVFLSICALLIYIECGGGLIEEPSPPPAEEPKIEETPKIAQTTVSCCGLVLTGKFCTRAYFSGCSIFVPQLNLLLLGCGKIPEKPKEALKMCSSCKVETNKPFCISTYFHLRFGFCLFLKVADY